MSLKKLLSSCETCFDAIIKPSSDIGSLVTTLETTLKLGLSPYLTSDHIDKQSVTDIITSLSKSPSDKFLVVDLLQIKAYILFFNQVKVKPEIIKICQCVSDDDFVTAVLSFSSPMDQDPFKKASLFFHTDKTIFYPEHVRNLLTEVQKRMVLLKEKIQQRAKEQVPSLDEHTYPAESQPQEWQKSDRFFRPEPHKLVKWFTELQRAIPLDLIALLAKSPHIRTQLPEPDYESRVIHLSSFIGLNGPHVISDHTYRLKCIDEYIKKHPEEALAIHVGLGNKEEVQKLLQSDHKPSTLIDRMDKYSLLKTLDETIYTVKFLKWTPLAVAVEMNDLEMAALLLQYDRSSLLVEQEISVKHQWKLITYPLILQVKSLEMLLLLLREKYLSSLDPLEFSSFLEKVLSCRDWKGQGLLSNIFNEQRGGFSLEERIQMGRLLAPFVYQEHLDKPLLALMFSSRREELDPITQLLLSRMRFEEWGGITTLAPGLLLPSDSTRPLLIQALLSGNKQLIKLVAVSIKDAFYSSGSPWKTVLEIFLEELCEVNRHKSSGIPYIDLQQLSFINHELMSGTSEDRQALWYRTILKILYRGHTSVVRKEFKDVLGDHFFNELNQAKTFLEKNWRYHEFCQNVWNTISSSHLEYDSKTFNNFLVALSGQLDDSYLIAPNSDAEDLRPKRTAFDDILINCLLEVTLKKYGLSCANTTRSDLLHLWKCMEVLYLDNIRPTIIVGKESPKINIPFVLALLKNETLGQLSIPLSSTVYLFLKLVMYQRAHPEAFSVIDLITMRVSKELLEQAGFSEDEIVSGAKLKIQWANVFSKILPVLPLTEGDVLPFTLIQLRQRVESKKQQLLPPLPQKFNDLLQSIEDVLSRGSVAKPEELLSFAEAFNVFCPPIKSMFMFFKPATRDPLEIPELVLAGLRAKIQSPQKALADQPAHPN